MKIGIIGVGTMGYQLAKNFLKDDVEVGIYDLNTEAILKLEKMGALSFQTPSELAKHYQYIITILPNSSIVQSVVLGDNGLINGLQKNSIIIDMTSSDPLMTKELADILGRSGYRMIDAPVSGGVSKAIEGNLTIMVGGPRADVEEAMPLLKIIGEHIFHVGEIGAGHTIKALNNLVSATTLAVTAEALALGTKLGLDPEKMLEVINASTGRSLSSEQKFPNQILNRKFSGGFALDLMVKDITIAINLANVQRAPMQIASASYQLWKQAWIKGDPTSDHTTVVKEIEESLKVEIKAQQ